MSSTTLRSDGLDEADLVRVAHALRADLPDRIEHYVVGKTAMRDAIVSRYQTSEERAEEVVDALERRGLIRFHGYPTALDREPGTWTVDVDPR